MELIQSEQQKEKRILKSEDSLKGLTGHQQGSQKEKREKEAEKLFEKMMVENFPNLGKEIDTQIQESQRVPNKTKPKRLTPRHMIIKKSNVKDKKRILKAARKKNKTKLVTYKGAPIRLSTETFQTRTVA